MVCIENTCWTSIELLYKIKSIFALSFGDCVWSYSLQWDCRQNLFKFNVGLMLGISTTIYQAMESFFCFGCQVLPFHINPYLHSFRPKFKKLFGMQTVPKHECFNITQWPIKKRWRKKIMSKIGPACTKVVLVNIYPLIIRWHCVTFLLFQS